MVVDADGLNDKEGVTNADVVVLSVRLTYAEALGDTEGAFNVDGLTLTRVPNGEVDSVADIVVVLGDVDSVIEGLALIDTMLAETVAVNDALVDIEGTADTEGADTVAVLQGKVDREGVAAQVKVGDSEPEGDGV
jgi:hypothetical protein